MKNPTIDELVFPEIDEPLSFDAPSVAIVGNLSEGFRIYGPFTTFDEATTWCEGLGVSGDTWIARLYTPVKHDFYLS